MLENLAGASATIQVANLVNYICHLSCKNMKKFFLSLVKCIVYIMVNVK